MPATNSSMISPMPLMSGSHLARIGLSLALAFAASRAAAVTPTPEELSLARQWTATHLKSDERNAWEFMYDQGGSFGIMKGWTTEQSEQRVSDNSTQTTFVSVDPKTKLEVELQVTEYDDSPAVEWVLRFTNRGDKPTPILQNVLPLSTEFRNSTSGAPFRIRYALGSHERTDDFRMTETQTVSAPEVLSLKPFGGRSSDGCLPFFNLLKESGGVCIGIGWTGQWQTTFQQSDDSTMSVRAGMEFTHFRLQPGESVRTPAILLVFWEGDDPLRGHNLLRATLRDHFTPRPGDQQVEIPVSMSVHKTHRFESTTAEDMIAFIDEFTSRASEFDAFWIDTGWFDLIDNNWARSVGNFEPDKGRYPDGMKPVADAAHRQGLKFLLWFEPERVMPDTWLMKNHPDWLIAPPSNLPFQLTYQFFDGFHLLDLGRESVRDWLTQKTIAQISQMGVDVYRQDFNMYPLYYWRAQDAADRQGVREMQYVDGLYQYWDALLAAYPNLLIDNCASGGRRIDFETLRRSVPLFRSDMAYRSPLASQCHQYALSYWIPYHGLGTVTTDPYAFRSGLGAVFTTAFDLKESEAEWKTLDRMIGQYKRFRSAYLGDYFPLTPYTLDPSGVLAFQFNRPDLGSGLVQAFRREQASRDSLTVRLRALDPEATYLVTNLDRPRQTDEAKGADLMNAGLVAPLPRQPSAAVILYHKK